MDSGDRIRLADTDLIIEIEEDYAIRGEEGSKIISVNGAAAHKAGVGHRLIICAYAHYSEAELANFQPRVLYMGADGELSLAGLRQAVAVLPQDLPLAQKPELCFADLLDHAFISVRRDGARGWFDRR